MKMAREMPVSVRAALLHAEDPTSGADKKLIHDYVNEIGQKAAYLLSAEYAEDYVFALVGIQNAVNGALGVLSETERKVFEKFTSNANVTVAAVRMTIDPKTGKVVPYEPR